MEGWNWNLLRALGCDCQCVVQWNVTDKYDGQLGSWVVLMLRVRDSRGHLVSADCRLVLELVAWCSVGVHVTHAAWGCNVLQGAAGVSNTMLLVLVRPACTGQKRGPAPGGKDHPPGGMAGRRYSCQVVAIRSQVVWPLGRTSFGNYNERIYNQSI